MLMPYHSDGAKCYLTDTHPWGVSFICVYISTNVWLINRKYTGVMKEVLCESIHK